MPNGIKSSEPSLVLSVFANCSSNCSKKDCSSSMSGPSRTACDTLLPNMMLCKGPIKEPAVDQQAQHAQHAQQATCNHQHTSLIVVQVKQQVQDFKVTEARVAEAEQHALSYSSREAALTARQQGVAALEDKAQQANAAAEYARKEADAMWDKQKVTTHHAANVCLSMCACV